MKLLYFRRSIVSVRLIFPANFRDVNSVFSNSNSTELYGNFPLLKHDRLRLDWGFVMKIKHRFKPNSQHPCCNRVEFISKICKHTEMPIFRLLFSRLAPFAKRSNHTRADRIRVLDSDSIHPNRFVLLFNCVCVQTKDVVRCVVLQEEKGTRSFRNK